MPFILSGIDSCAGVPFPQERRQKEDLAGQVSQLLNDNKRLQGESASTAEQLQQFTDWFFNAIEK